MTIDWLICSTSGVLYCPVFSSVQVICDAQQAVTTLVFSGCSHLFVLKWACACLQTCGKQYKNAAEMEAHLSSYDHHHKKVSMKAEPLTLNHRSCQSAQPCCHT